VLAVAKTKVRQIIKLQALFRGNRVRKNTLFMLKSKRVS
jgi:hypothetical protein